MNQSLSIILPVSNAELGLTEKVEELLEVVADLTADFELLIVDDGSTDDTEEVSLQLKIRYPQVGVLRLPKRMGDIEAAKAGIAKASADLLLIHDIESTLNGEALRQLWSMRNQQEFVFARLEPPHVRSRPRIAGAAWKGTQMLRRDAVEEFQSVRKSN